MSLSYEEFAAAVTGRGWVPSDCGGGHWEIRAERRREIVRWWPFSGLGTLYVSERKIKRRDVRDLGEVLTVAAEVFDAQT